MKHSKPEKGSKKKGQVTTTVQEGSFDGVEFTYRHTETIPSRGPLEGTPSQPESLNQNLQWEDLNSSQNSPSSSYGSGARQFLGSIASAAAAGATMMVSSMVNARPISRERFVVTVEASFKNEFGESALDTQELQFGTLKAAQEYASKFHPDQGLAVKITGPFPTQSQY